MDAFAARANLNDCARGERIVTDSHLGCGCPGCSDASGRGLTRRTALRLGLGAGAAAAIAPRLHLGGDDATPLDAERLAFQAESWPTPPIVTRAQWGANEALRKPGNAYDNAVQKIVVHHTATPNNPPDPARVVRGIYEYAVSREYIDIQYNWLIDQHGRIYEGRWARSYPPGTAHNGENANGSNVRGAHALDHNSRTIGVAFIGTFTTMMPTPAAMEALYTLLAWKCARWSINPVSATPYRLADGSTQVFRDVRQTTCPGDPLLGALPAVRNEVAARLRTGAFGYWIATSDGRALAYADNPDRGDPKRLGINANIIGIAAHPDNRGYWLLGRDGGIFTFGDAHFFGSTGNIRLNRPIVGMTPTPSGRGYWLVASDGGIFAFGDAHFYGSTGAMHLNRPIVGMARTPTGNGYWLVASDGGIFAFGDAHFHGSAGARGTPSPVVGMLATNTGNGYSMLTSDGSVYSYGDAPFYGSAAGQVARAVGFAGRLVAR
jgi:hypothetical protein